MSANEHCPTCRAPLNAAGRCPRCTAYPMHAGESDVTFDLATDHPPGFGALEVELASEHPPSAELEVDLATDKPAARKAELKIDLESDKPPPPAPSSRRQLPPLLPPAALVPPPPEPASDPRILALAGYDLPPTHFFASVPYAWRVYRRRTRLREQHATQARARDDRRRELRQELAQILDDATHDRRDELGDVLQPVLAADELMRSRSQDLETSSDQHASRIADLGGNIGRLEEASKQCTRERSLAQATVEEAQAQLTRAQDDKRRVASLLESAHDAARAAAGRGAEFAPPEHAHRITELDAELARAQTALEACDTTLREAQEQLRLRERALKDAEAQVDRLKSAKRTAEREAHAARELSSASLREANEQRLDACEQTLTILVAERPQLFATDTLARAETLKSELVELDVDLERHRLAIHAYDQRAFRRGWMLVAGAALTVVVLLALLVGIA
ncbi:MAG TPA: hypothetical protein VFB62_00815 [Polyangiaceae bacterium]|nr:hypothetical protein [Polyangiaceae bacterium]